MVGISIFERDELTKVAGSIAQYTAEFAGFSEFQGLLENGWNGLNKLSQWSFQLFRKVFQPPIWVLSFNYI